MFHKRVGCQEPFGDMSAVAKGQCWGSSAAQCAGATCITAIKQETKINFTATLQAGKRRSHLSRKKPRPNWHTCLVCLYEELERTWKNFWRACNSGCVSKTSCCIVSAATIQVFSAAFLYWVWSDLPATVWLMQWGLQWYRKMSQSVGFWSWI